MADDPSRSDQPYGPPAPSPSSPSSTSDGQVGARGAPTSRDADPSPSGQADKPSMLPALSIPKGGGAIRGIGEKFAVNAATGTASLGVPLPASPGRGGFGPQVDLGYDSGHGNGSFGLGFGLSVPTITRKTDKGLPRYYDVEESDEFILSGAEDLVPTRVVGPGGALVLEVLNRGDHVVQRYRPRVEGLFARIERHTASADGAIHWEVTTKDNVTHFYGRTAGSQVVDPVNPRRVFSWLLEESRDDHGNVVRYEYKPEDGVGVDATRTSERCRFETRGGNRRFVATAQRYLKRVLYANFTPGQSSDFLFEMVLDYGEHAGDTPTPAEDLDWPVRVDPFSTHRAGFEVRTYRLCTRVLMFHRLSDSRTPLLVRSTAFDYEPGPAFTYLRAVTQYGYLFDPRTGALVQRLAMPTLALDYARPVLNDELAALPPDSLEGLQGGVAGASKQWVDLDGEGIPGVLIDSEHAWYYKSNAGGGQLAPPRALRTLPSPSSLAGGVQQLQDLGGDGQLDLVAYAAPLSGYASRTSDGDFERLRTFPALPNLDWQDPNLRFLDVDGDGLPDVIITEHQAFVWYRSKAKDGFEPAQRIFHPSDEDKGAAVVFADATQSVQLADMSGDGLTDIVRVRNGEVCYWPNLGYGRFGPKVTLEASPVFAGLEEFDARRIRFGDVDGSGTSDLFYLGTRGVTLYYNQSGNRLSAATPITSLPAMDSAAQVSVVDLLGTGTASLVWSSPLPSAEGRQVLYVDLMGGVKPHLLQSVVNNLGAETQITYAPSTKFYLEDKAAGTPWLTRLAFPVQVVERVDRLDRISKSHVVATYRYRHGFFDGVEREFRGFARVEETDAEEFTVGAAGTELFQPPTRTVSWFHTGAWLEKERLERELAKEYFQGGPTPLLLPDTVLTGDLTIQDQREAARALRGRLLHQEVYANDAAENPTQAPLPFAVTEQSYEVRLLQTSKGWRHGVFLTIGREAVAVHTERNPTDPRVTHDMVLDVDDFANVTRRVALAYGRANAAQPEQARAWATLSEMSYVNHAGEDFHRVGVPIETATFEVTGLSNLPFAGQGLIDTDVLRQALDGIDAAHDVPYDEAPPATGTARRMIDRKQQLYYNDDLSAALDLGQISSRALPFESYQLALTSGQVATLVTESVALANGVAEPTPIPDLLLGAGPGEGHYVQRPDDTGYWIPSGRLIFDAGHFYVPIEAIDGFGKRHFATYDGFSLLVEATSDPLGNVVRASNDYRVLMPFQVTDLNLDQVAVSFDALGVVVATAVMGKEGANEGDTLDDPTARLQYDLLRWQTSTTPVVVHGTSREVHRDPTTGFQQSYTYYDGFGRVVMHKVQAEPGDAPLRDASGELVRDANGDLVVGPVAVRWIGTGRVVFNNKGNAVKQYEPFFSSTFEFESEDDLVQWGVTPLIHHDALDRVVRTELPNGSEARIEEEAWVRRNLDPNDSVRGTRWLAERQTPGASSSDQRAAALALEHADTPTVTHLDCLGRSFLLVEQNRFFQSDGSFTDAFYETRTVHDIEGNALSLVDARQAALSQDSPLTPKPAPLATFIQRFDVLSRRQRVDSTDAGVRLTLVDAGGKPLRRWDSRGQIFRYRYDDLQRHTHLFAEQTVAERPGQDLTERLVVRTVFGEALDPPVAPAPPPPQPPSTSAAQSLNLRDRVYRVYDCAGLVTNVRFDFKGNLLDSERRLALDYHVEPKWNELAELSDAAAIQVAAEPLLEPPGPLQTVFATHSDYDALNRVTRHVTPDASVSTPTYNEASLLDRLEIGVRGGPTRTVIANIDYNARGQRLLYEYADPTAAASAVTCRVSYLYDPFTFRLTNLVTTRAADNLALQDLRYTYDPVGNIVELQDRGETTPTIFTVGPISGDGLYRYDPLYRLIEAQGREHPGQTGTSTQPSDVDFPVGAIPHPNDLQGLVRYLERYVYDPVGNIQSMGHTTTAANGGPGPSQTQWTRRYNYALDSNRLLGASVAGDTDGTFSETFDPDPHGSMRRMLHLQVIDWDYADRMQHANKGGGGDVFFTYDGSGLRVRKVWEHSGLVEERIYVGGWETFRRRRAGILELERETLHVVDGERRVAMVETKTTDTVDGGTGIARWRVQLDNHLGSAVLELSEAGEVISYEEYHPFGSTAFHSASGGAEVSAKRYRYTGKEKDEETGLYYHGARYYASWLGRWTAADPAGLADGPNLFAYARNQPVTLVDPNGRQSAGAFGVNPEIIKHGNYTGGETQSRLRHAYAKLHVYYRGDAVWNGELKSWFVDRSQLVKAPKPSKPHPGAGGKGGDGVGAGPSQPKAPEAPAPGTTGPAPAPAPESTAPPSTAPGPTADPNRPATAGEALKAFAGGAVKGALLGGALIALGPVGAAIGLGLLAYGAFKLLSGGYKEVGAAVGRLATGQGTASDFEALGGVVGGIAAGGVAGIAKGGAAGAEGGAAGAEGAEAGVEAAGAGGEGSAAVGRNAAGPPPQRVMVGTSKGDVVATEGGRVPTGLSRELRVAEEVGGRVGRTPGSPTKDLLVRGGGTGARIDVVGPNGELIIVGGPSKVANLGGLGDNLTRLLRVANATNVRPLAYFEEGTPASVIELAQKILGAANVRTFPR